MLADTAGATARTVEVEGLGFSPGLRLFLGGLPVEELRIQSEASLSFIIPRGYTGGAADLLGVTAGGWESTWPRFFSGQEAMRLPDRGPAFSPLTFTVHGRALTEQALRTAGGSLLIPEQALLELGARPHLVSEIGRTYWTSVARTADYTMGRAAAAMTGQEVALALPVYRHGTVTYLDAVLVRHLAGEALLVQAGAVHAGMRDLGGHWARLPIIDLWQGGIVNGTGDGLFRPDEGLTRAAFVKMAVGARGLEAVPGDTGGFTDVAGHWVTAQGYLGAAVAAGIILPAEYSGHRFEPDRPISREEMAVMVTRALGLEAQAQSRMLTVEGGTVSLGGRRFTDAGVWSRPGHVAVAVEHGIIMGYSEAEGHYTFRPARSATRAEAAVMITRMQIRLKSPATH